MTSDDLLKHFEYRLNQIALNNEVDIVFKGGVDYVDDKWVEKRFGLPLTYFALITNGFEETDNSNTINFDYQLFFLNFDRDRKEIEAIMELFYAEISSQIVIGDYDIYITPRNITYGNSMASGNGDGELKFQTLITFSGNATTAYTLRKNIILTIDGERIPINSFKFDHGKVDYVNKITKFKSDNNHNLNNNFLVIGTPLLKDTDIIEKFLTTGQDVNITNQIKLLLGTNVVIDDLFQFEGFTLATDKGTPITIVYLYFSYASDKIFITINDEELPILDFAITLETSNIPHDRPDSNFIKHIYTGKVRTYAFNVAEDMYYEVLRLFTDVLISDEEIIPLYNLKFITHDKELNKTLLLDSITKESKETGNSVYKIVMLESGELNG